MRLKREKTREKTKPYYLIVAFLATLLTIALHFTHKHGNIIILQQQELRQPNQEQYNSRPRAGDDENDDGHDKVTGCDLLSGRWVYDNTSYPLYEESKCYFMIDDFSCQRNGRDDSRFEKWAWKPHHCDLPRFDGKKLMEKIRGKRVVFVGDSLSRNQWVSMLCLVDSSLDRTFKRNFVRNDNLFAIHITEYNATIEFYWSPYFVESNADDPYYHSLSEEILLKVKSIEKHAKHWTHADILIFDSYAWWNFKSNITLLWGSFESPEATHKDVSDIHHLYEMSLDTWSDWLEFNTDRTKTKLFFMSLSPYHDTSQELDGRTCYKETEPTSEEGYRGSERNREMMRITESKIERMKERGVVVHYLNITHLTDLRMDAHVSIYKKFRKPKSKEEIESNGVELADCVHWCLPGVPDFWNILLYHYITNIA